MNPGWSVEGDRLACRWSEALESSHYNPEWFREASPSVFETTPAPFPDFAAHSLLGSGEWIAPWQARWSVIARSWS